ncbi:hypothetical protein PG993_007990 [Apiospora rasikravindrae]|uniref:Uncharacterized protein n=1 Tax=Apiospora rasikravindrae TaxID=990691 RepID=A0ABR1SZ22_9PEZI
MSSTVPVLTAAQRDHINTAWDRIASRCVRDQILACALLHWDRVEPAGSVLDAKQLGLFLDEAAENRESGETKGNEFKVYRGNYGGRWELREILPNDTHASIIINLSWELSADEKASLEGLISANLASPDVPASLIKFTYRLCNTPMKDLPDDVVIGCDSD